MHKEQNGLDGRTLDVGNLKIHVQKAIAEGGFSCVYLARDAMHATKQYALKHIICNDMESLDVVMKEIQVMKSLRGHHNVVTLCAHTILDMGRTKEALLVMEYCEKSLVSVQESRGAGYFEEKQVLAIFRDVCNAVFAMHCQSPPIAHRDLKAENLLLGSDGLWKLCDFGSTSTNHKRFEKPEEMGIEEDNIRKHTTPAYRPPEMWDLFRRELINEKVDIWALGCLLYRICYFKSAFDGESKLQVLNGNYRIPELPKYSSSITDLIRDMLQASPDDRPDITQVWFRVNELLPVELQKSLPDRPPEMLQSAAEMPEGIPRAANRSPPMPRRSPPPVPSSGEPARNTSPPTSVVAGGGGQLGAFWSTQHAKDSVGGNKAGPKFDEEPSSHIAPERNQSHLEKSTSPSKEENGLSRPMTRNVHGKSPNRSEDGPPSKDFEIRFFQENSDRGRERTKPSKLESTPPAFQNEVFNTFVADFDTSKLSPAINNKGKEHELEAEVDKLKEQLKQANLEKAEITSKFEKLSTICRTQRQEIQELKQALAATNPSPNRDVSRKQTSPGIRPSAPSSREKNEGSMLELQQGSVGKISPSPDPKTWRPFAEDPKPQQAPLQSNSSKSVRTRNGQPNKPASAGNFGTDTWGFGTESFTAVPTSSPQISRPIGEGNTSQRFGQSKSIENKSASQPAGWAGF